MAFIENKSINKRLEQLPHQLQSAETLIDSNSLAKFDKDENSVYQSASKPKIAAVICNSKINRNEYASSQC